MLELLENSLKGCLSSHNKFLLVSQWRVRPLVLERIRRGVSYKGEKVVSLSPIRYGAYSYKYGRWKERRGLDHTRYNLFLTGLFYKKTGIRNDFEGLSLPSERWFLAENPKIAPNYFALTNLSDAEKEKILEWYAYQVFSKLEAAF